jgi:hypothetical protein
MTRPSDITRERIVKAAQRLFAFQKSTSRFSGFLNVAVIPFERQQRIVALAGDEKFDCLCRFDVSSPLAVIHGKCNHVAAEQLQQGYSDVRLLVSWRWPLSRLALLEGASLSAPDQN